MKTRKENWRSFIVTLTMALFMATMLMACSSKAAPAGETKETEAADIKEETVEVAEVKEAEPTLKPTPEPTAEPTSEPTPEPIVYEGIDMESTLPGKEWVATFFGIIEEPKGLLINDSTNKKLIIEDGQEVYYEEGDTFVIYLPNADMWISDYSGMRTKDGLETYNRYYNSFTFDEENLKRQKNFSVTIVSEEDEKVNIRLTYKFQPIE